MARTTKQLSGAGKDKFLRGLIASEPGISSEAASALGETMCEAIADVRVRRDAWEERRQATAARSATPAIDKPVPALPVTTSSPASTAAAAGPDATVFDPFAFSALAVLTKKGRAALAEQFGKIDAADHLHAIAAAQHLTVDAGLKDLAQLREALVKATEARLAERRAAAS
jgi:hypothetical protein